jgi:hypothetical protein
MRRILLAATFAALLAPSTAIAVGIDLNWDNCLFNAANRVADKTFACDTNDGGPFQLFGSLRTGIALSGVTGWSADIYIFPGPGDVVANDWWRMGAQDCREGGISFVGLPAQMTNVTPCAKGLVGAGTPTVGSAYFLKESFRDWYRVGVLWTSGITVSATAKYQLFRIDLNTSRTVSDPGHPENGVCAGCLELACIELALVEVHRPGGSPNGLDDFFNSEISSWVTWQWGGYYPQYSCPYDTGDPVRRSTWGQVKSLYR